MSPQDISTVLFALDAAYRTVSGTARLADDGTNATRTVRALLSEARALLIAELAHATPTDASSSPPAHV